MSSFYAELVVAGQTYPVRQCQLGFAQATDQRGRVQAKVRHGLLHLTLDVPDTDQLLDWANTAHKPLSGHVTFFETNRQTARETVSFAAGQCVGYQETFAAGNGEAGAYVCQLTITSDGLTLAPGGPAGAFVAPAAREYTAPAAAMAVAIGGMAPKAVKRLPLITGHPPFTVKGASKGKPALDRAEYLRQLTGQQDGLNRLTVAEFLTNRDAYNNRKNTQPDGRDPQGNKFQELERQKAQARKVRELRQQNTSLSKKQAEDQADAWLRTQAALHDPDQVAGGYADRVTGVGDARTNSAIGAAWPKRIKDIDKQVRSHASTMTYGEQATTYLDIFLPVR